MNDNLDVGKQTRNVPSDRLLKVARPRSRQDVKPIPVEADVEGALKRNQRLSLGGDALGQYKVYTPSPEEPTFMTFVA